MYTEVCVGGLKLSSLIHRFRNDDAGRVLRVLDLPNFQEWRMQVLLLHEVILLHPALAGSQRRLRRKILTNDKRRYRNAAPKPLWGEASKRRIMARQISPHIDAPTGLVNPNAVSPFQGMGTRHFFKLRPETPRYQLPGMERDD